ncbi:MAG: M15 family metallopeptidase [Bacillota bacterium]|nr:M15 family metallopeptidase [Bacillota bacterium]
MKQDLLCLLMAYPEFAVDVKKECDGRVYLIMKSGQKILYDDKKNKSFDEKFQNPDLQDMMEQIYPLTAINKVSEKNFDPGRIRVYSLLSEVYGLSRKSIETNLVNTNLGYRYYQFNKSNKAADSLKNAMSEIVPLANSRKDVGGCLYPSCGTYNYRVISGTNKLSPHAYGIAIDLARDKRDYWKWASPEEGSKRIEAYPKDMVEILEKNNFVWGGKWSHFDTLHFEYRPEIIMKARYFAYENREGNQWYGNVDYQDSFIKNCIDKINNAVGTI